MIAAAMPLRRLGPVRLGVAGAARLAAACGDLMPHLPRRFLHHGGGHEAAHMPASKAPDPAPFTGELPDGIDPAAHGVPWEWWRARLLGDPVAWQAVQNAERDYERETGNKSWRAPRQNPPVGWCEPKEKDKNAWTTVVEKRKCLHNAWQDRIKFGNLRLFACELSDGRYRWLTPPLAVYFAPLIMVQPFSNRRPAVLAARQRWCDPHVHVVDGLPLSLAVLVLSRPGALAKLAQLKNEDNEGMRELGTEPPAWLISRLMDELRADLKARLAAGGLEAIGDRGAGPEPIPPAAWSGDAPDFDASTVGQFSAVLVHQPLPAGAGERTQPNAGADAAHNPEKRAKDWILGQLKAGRRERNKGAWNAAVLSQFPTLSGEAWKRIWAVASKAFPELGKPGRRPD